MDHNNILEASTNNAIHNANPKEYFLWHSIPKIILFIE